MMDSFIFPGLATRVVFGAGTMARVEEEVRRLGHDKALVLSTPHQKADAEKLAESLRGLAVGIFPGAVTHSGRGHEERAPGLPRQRRLGGR
jgi:maleylacetate reductase